MRTQLLGNLPIDQARLQQDLERSAEFRFLEPYSEFLCGKPWKSCTIWAAGQEAGDGVITHYDTSKPRGFTEHGNQLPYLRDLIERSFAIDHLVLARLAIISASVVIPHRDYVELGDTPEADRPAHRLHVPLVTSEDSYFAEENQVYRMRFGEVWSLDAARVHSAAVFSDIQRMHLILDFTDASHPADLVQFPIEEAPGVPARSLCPREPLTDQERADLLALTSIVDHDNLWDVVSIVIKKYFRRDGGPDFVWKTVSRIVELSDDEAIQTRVRGLHRYYLQERDE